MICLFLSLGRFIIKLLKAEVSGYCSYFFVFFSENTCPARLLILYNYFHIDRENYKKALILSYQIKAFWSWYVRIFTSFLKVVFSHEYIKWRCHVRLFHLIFYLIYMPTHGLAVFFFGKKSSWQTSETWDHGVIYYHLKWITSPSIKYPSYN